MGKTPTMSAAMIRTSAASSGTSEVGRQRAVAAVGEFPAPRTDANLAPVA